MSFCRHLHYSFLLKSRGYLSIWWPARNKQSKSRSLVSKKILKERGYPSCCIQIEVPVCYFPLYRELKYVNIVAVGLQIQWCSFFIWLLHCYEQKSHIPLVVHCAYCVIGKEISVSGLTGAAQIKIKCWNGNNSLGEGRGESVYSSSLNRIERWCSWTFWTNIIQKSWQAVVAVWTAALPGKTFGSCRTEMWVDVTEGQIAKAAPCQ